MEKLNLMDLAVESRVSDWDMARFDLINTGSAEPLEDAEWVARMNDLEAMKGDKLTPEIVKSLETWYAE